MPQHDGKPTRVRVTDRGRFWVALFVGLNVIACVYISGWANGYWDAEKTAGHVICARDGERCPP